MGVWIDFIRTADSPSGKTRTWDVRTKSDAGAIGDRLGAIGWFGRWRCYSFYPASNTVFEKACLRDIASFCEKETYLHRVRGKT